jgi:hypothetical protein
VTIDAIYGNNTAKSMLNEWQVMQNNLSVGLHLLYRNNFLLSKNITPVYYNTTYKILIVKENHFIVERLGYETNHL